MQSAQARCYPVCKIQHARARRGGHERQSDIWFREKPVRPLAYTGRFERRNGRRDCGADRSAGIWQRHVWFSSDTGAFLRDCRLSPLQSENEQALSGRGHRTIRARLGRAVCCFHSSILSQPSSSSGRSAHVGLAENALGLSDVASWRRGLVPALSVTFPLVACGRLSARLPDGRLQASDRYHWTPS
jgi:hypothetical protein